jgi:hypothetical protein
VGRMVGGARGSMIQRSCSRGGLVWSSRGMVARELHAPLHQPKLLPCLRVAAHLR